MQLLLIGAISTAFFQSNKDNNCHLNKHYKCCFSHCYPLQRTATSFTTCLVTSFLFPVRCQKIQPATAGYEPRLILFPFSHTTELILFKPKRCRIYSVFIYAVCLFCILVAACRSVTSVLQKQLTEEKDKKEQILTERDRLSQVKNSDKELIFPYG